MNYRILTRITALLGALILFAALTTSASAASAPPTPPIGAAPVQGMAASLATIGDPTSSQIDAATSCINGITHRVTISDYGVVIAWLQMTTNFCYNHVIVTSHTTKVTHFTVWSYAPSPYSFVCYVASGSTRQCSGNQETEDDGFYSGNIACDIRIQETENYRGQWWINWSWFCA
jgi:hypothetical protein